MGRVLFISSMKPARLGAFDLRLPATAMNGLKIDSVIKTDKIRRFKRKLSWVS